MRIPIATYRLQLNHRFGFRAAKEIVPYLAELGVTDIYASPIFKAKKGSLHGYDVVDPNELNPELGAESDFEELVAEAQKHGLGWLQDIVPNHMAFDSENQMLMDVFENGRNSPFFDFFDIDWNRPDSNKAEVFAPFLGKFYGDALEGGEISLIFGPDGLAAKYYDFVFPLKAESYGSVFTHRLSVLREKLGETNSDFIRYLGALYVLQALLTQDSDPERHERVTVIKKTFWDLYEESATVREFIDENIKEFNGSIGDAASFNLLDDLLSEQLFRFSFWKVASEEINYRRFFSINNLISIKLADGAAFEHLHALIFRLISEKKITGIRVDHIDGLCNPTQYLREMKVRTKDMYTVVEKILDFEEELPRVWPVEGTTGYDFLNYVNELFCRPNNEAAIDKSYSNFSGIRSSFDHLVYEKKRLIIETQMGGEVDALARLLKKISGRDRHGRDITLYGLRRALVEMLAQFPVYRTYINSEFLSEQDQGYINEAARRAIMHNRALLNEINFLKEFLLLEFGPHVSEEEKKQRVEFVMRFQQFTGPLMAKGFEDTLLYVYNRLISLNEVGGAPQRFGLAIDQFHRFNQTRKALWPHALNATSTHDTKRGEDARARINVISEMPKEWEASLKKWNRLNRKKKGFHDDMIIPDQNDEYFFYQTLVGAFPAEKADYDSFVKRMGEYATKVVREAKVHTAWIKPDVEYENGFSEFVTKTITPLEENAFMEEFLDLQRKIAHYGVFNSLSQALLKAAAPGVPDFYQGTELWDLSLVDPDNRRPVDFEMRKKILADLQKKTQNNLPRLLKELLSSKEDGRIKLFLTHRLLLARKERRQLFEEGSYVPLEAGEQFHENIMAFARIYQDLWAIAVAPRFLTGLMKEDEFPLGENIWKNGHIILPEGSPKSWENIITKEHFSVEKDLPLGKALERFPVALLINEEPR